MHIYTHMHAYIHKQSYVCIHIHICVCVNVCASVHMHAQGLRLAALLASLLDSPWDPPELSRLRIFLWALVVGPFWILVGSVLYWPLLCIIGIS